MTSDTTVVALRQPEAVEDPLTAVLRRGARRLLAQAVEAEAEAFLAEMRGLRLPDGRERLVRHGYGPERLVQTGIGPVPVRRVKLRDRGTGLEGERIRFTSALLPRWARRTPSLDALLPILYLRGVSMGDFQEALAALLGRDAPNLSPSVIARLRGEWEAEHARWQRRERFLEVAHRDPAQVEHWQQRIQAPGPPRPARQNGGGEADALAARAGAAVAQLHPAHRDRADPGLHQALRTVAVSHQALAPVRQPHALHRGQERFGFGLHRLRQQPPGAAPQDFRERVIDGVGLAEADHSGIAHRGVSLLREVLAGSSPASIRRLSQSSITHFPP